MPYTLKPDDALTVDADNNTVRDLLSVDTEPANDFPQDDSAHGFDNIADALSLSPTLMEKYLAARRQSPPPATRECVPTSWT